MLNSLLTCFHVRAISESTRYKLASIEFFMSTLFLTVYLCFIVFGYFLWMYCVWPVLSFLSPLLWPSQLYFSLVLGTLPLNRMQTAEWRPGFAESCAKGSWNSLLTENWKDSFVLDEQENQLQLLGSSGVLRGGLAGLGVWEFELSAWLCCKH